MKIKKKSKGGLEFEENTLVAIEKLMRELNWTWVGTNGSPITVKMLKKLANRLYKDLKQSKDSYGRGAGGLEADRDFIGGQIAVSFRVGVAYEKV